MVFYLQTELNKKVDSFFKKYELTEITLDTVKKFFNLQEKNNYGNILHAIVNYKYNNDKMIKTIELLLELGIDVNHKASETGYSFIHLALYGYTENETEYSYSTDFIVKLIELAKKYNFNVNITDHDDDTIIHAALASEDYTGKIMPLIDALGVDFDLKKKDNQQNDIYQALVVYKKQAEKDGNQSWLKKLTDEETEIKICIEKSKYNLEDINKKLEELTSKFNELMSNITILNILECHEDFQKLIKEFNIFLKQKAFFTQETSDHIDVESKYYSKVKVIINDTLNRLKENPRFKDIKTLESIINNFSFQEELEKLDQIKQNYQKSINILKEKIEQCDSLFKLNKIASDLENIADEEVKVELIELLNNKKQILIDLIEKITKIQTQIKLINDWMVRQPFFEFDTSSQKTLIDLETKNFQQLSEYYQEQNANLSNLKQIIQDNLKSLIQSFDFLIENKLMTQQELWKPIINSQQESNQPATQKAKRQTKQARKK